MATRIRQSIRRELALAGLTGFLLLLGALVLVGVFVFSLGGIGP